MSLVGPAGVYKDELAQGLPAAVPHAEDGFWMPRSPHGSTLALFQGRISEALFHPNRHRI